MGATSRTPFPTKVPYCQSGGEGHHRRNHIAGICTLALSTLVRLLPVGAVRGGIWMLRGPVDEEEHDFIYWFTRTMYPVWAVVGACLLVYGLFFS